MKLLKIFQRKERGIEEDTNALINVISSVRLSLMLLLTLSYKNYFLFNFSLFFFLNNTGKSSAFMEIIFSRDKFLLGKILSRSPLPQPIHHKKNPPWKRQYTFQ